MFWNLFRQDPRYYCLYEPFNSRLEDGILSADAIPLDATHLGVSDYWLEYRKLNKNAILDSWRRRSTVDRISLSPLSYAPAIRNYLNLLIQEAGAYGIPVLKFVMEDFRARWLARHYPSARIIHIQRNPRAVWSSMFRYRLPDDVRERPELRQSTFFVHIDKIADSLDIRVPGHPYRTFYLIWLLSREAVSSVADDTWWYEDAIEDYDEWAKKHLIEPGLFLSAPEMSKAEDSHRPSSLHADFWFLEQELWVYDWLGFSSTKWASRHPVQRFLKRVDFVTSGFPFRKIKRLGSKLFGGS